MEICGEKISKLDSAASNQPDTQATEMLRGVGVAVLFYFGPKGLTSSIYIRRFVIYCIFGESDLASAFIYIYIYI